MRISDWSSDVCSSDLRVLEIFDSNRAVLLAASSRKDFDWARQNIVAAQQLQVLFEVSETPDPGGRLLPGEYRADAAREAAMADNAMWALHREGPEGRILLFAHNGHIMNVRTRRSEEHTSELQSLMRNS